MSYYYYYRSGCGSRRTGGQQWTYQYSYGQPGCQQQQLQPTAPSPSTSADIDEDTFAEEMLKAHNEYRAKHGAPPLQLSKKICDFSKSWARNIAARNVLQHSQGSGYGENLCYLYANDFSARKAVDLWYNEVRQYHYSNNYFSPSTGHFTQLVWKDSKELGVGFARSSANTIYIAANYSPPGNYQGRFIDNVRPPV